MAKDENMLIATGRLGADPEMKYTNSGTAVTTFRVASSRTWKDASGEKHDETEWLSCVAWNKLAEIANQYLSKGSRVYIKGRLQTRSWDDAETGEKRYRTEVIVEDLIMLDGKKPEAEQQEPEQARPAAPAPKAQPARPAPRPRIPDDADLPF